MINRSLPWNYDFKFVVEEISNINDKAQVSIVCHMYCTTVRRVVTIQKYKGAL